MKEISRIERRLLALGLAIDAAVLVAAEAMNVAGRPVAGGLFATLGENHEALRASLVLGGLALALRLGVSLLARRLPEPRPASPPAPEPRCPAVARLARFAWVVPLAVGAVLLFHRIGDNCLDPVDESRHAAVSLGIARTGEFFPPVFQGEPYYKKPPFNLLLTAAVIRILGPTELAIRFFPALFGVGTALLTYFLALALFRDRSTALLAPLILLGFEPFLFEHCARMGVQDSPLVFLFTAALLSFHAARNRPALHVAAGLFVAFATLTKSAAGLLALLVMDLMLFAEAGEAGRRGWRRIAALHVAALLPVVLWYGGLAVGDPGSFREAFGQQVLDRIVGKIPFHQEGPWFLARQLGRNLAPLGYLLLLLPIALPEMNRRRREYGLAVLWVFFVVLVFSLSTSKSFWYSFPVLPALVCLLARVLVLCGGALTRVARGHALAKATVAAAALLIVLPPLARTYARTAEEARCQPIAPWARSLSRLGLGPGRGMSGFRVAVLAPRFEDLLYSVELAYVEMIPPARPFTVPDPAALPAILADPAPTFVILAEPAIESLPAGARAALCGYTGWWPLHRTRWPDDRGPKAILAFHVDPAAAGDDWRGRDLEPLEGTCARLAQTGHASGVEGDGGAGGAEEPEEAKLEGTIVFEAGEENGGRIATLDLGTGKRAVLGTVSADEGHPVWSPDGKWILFESSREGSRAIYRMREDGSGAERLSPLDAHTDRSGPCWFPDGKRIAYSAAPAGARQDEKETGRIYALDLATRAESLLTPPGPRSILPGLSPDGRTLAFARKKEGWDIWTLALGGGEPRRLTEAGGNCRPRWSPDGKRIAYVGTAKDDHGDIWTMDPDGRRKQRLTRETGRSDYYPSWSPDGRWIVYSSRSTEPGAKWRLRVVEAEGSRAARPIEIGSDAGDSDEDARLPDWKK